MFTFFLLTVGLFLIFLILLITGIVKRRKKPVYISLLFLLLSIFSGLYTGFLGANTAYKRIKETGNPLSRTGMEIYIALLDNPETNCVTVINKKDQVVPRLDCCIWLEFTTCPKELARIIAEKKLKSVASEIPDYSPPIWFKPEQLGAGSQIRRKFNFDDPNHDLILYFSKDSTHAYYCDMAE